MANGSFYTVVYGVDRSHLQFVRCFQRLASANALYDALECPRQLWHHTPPRNGIGTDYTPVKRKESLPEGVFYGDIAVADDTMAALDNATRSK